MPRRHLMKAGDRHSNPGEALFKVRDGAAEIIKRRRQTAAD